jgi:hypothetical protein
LLSSGVCSRDEATRVEDTVWQTLAAVAAEQQGHQRECDPVERFYQLVNAALASGNAHIALAINPDEPPTNTKHAKASGWRKHD